MSNELVGENKGKQVLPSERASAVSEQINRAVRILRVKSPSKRLMYQSAGLKPRRRDTMFSALMVLSFIFVFVLPSIIGTAYFGLIASSQYQSEARFVVRPATGGVGDRSSGGQNELPSDKIVQDTQVVMNYIISPAVLTDIRPILDLNAIFGNDDIDYFSRLDSDAPQEDVLEYWIEMVTVEAQPKSGIVTLKAKAFSEEHSQLLAETVMDLAEKRVNTLNAGIWDTLTESTTTELRDAQEGLAKTRVALQELQNKTGIFDVELQAKLVADTILEVQAALLELQARETLLSENLSADAPSLVQVRDQISTRQDQLRSLRAELAGSAGGAANLAEFSRELDLVLVDKDIAETRLQDAVKDYERIQLISQIQLVYLDQFLAPTLPQSSQHPERGKLIAATIGGSLLGWLILFAVLRNMRSKFD
jgi:capsular polysaccharide transport system permease protein